MLSTHLAILELAARHRLDSGALASLWRLARFGEQPPTLIPWLRHCLGYTAALLAGLGLVFVIASNWSAFGRTGQFLLLEVLVAATCLGAALLRPARQPLALLGLLAIGGLFAYFGQTYQTGADPWQLFALWSALALPLALAARSDVVWTAWIMVAITGIVAWDSAQTGGWLPNRYGVHIHAIASLMAIGLAISISMPLRRYTGAGSWPFNAAVLAAAAMTATTGSLDLFGDGGTYYLVSLLAFSGATTALVQRHSFNVSALSIVALGLNFLLVCGIANLVLSGSGNGFIFPLLVLGLASAGLLTMTVRWILSLTNKYREGPVQ